MWIVWRVGILGVLVLAAAAAGCGADSAPEPPATHTPTSEPSPAVTEAPAVSATGAATGSEPSAVGEFDIDVDTTLGEVYSAFAASEQACVRDVLGDDDLESMLDMTVLSQDGIDQSMAEISRCLNARTAREFFVSATIAAMVAGAEQQGLRTEVGTDERACIRDRLADVDVASMVDVLVSESTDPVLLNLLGCVPELLIESILADEGVALEELTDRQRSCLRDLVADTDWAALGIEAESESPELLAFGLVLVACVPEFMSADPPPEPGEDVADDHGDSRAQATAVTVGDATAGEIEHAGDVDFFVFEAELGRLYQIDVTLATLPDSVATLYDPDGAQLEHSDDHADTTASRIYWQALNSGNYYVAVEGWSDNTGAYTVSVVASDFVDDHSNVMDGATPVTVGEAAAGDMEHAGDVDFFVFEADQGQLYQIDVTLGTLPDSFAALYSPYVSGAPVLENPSRLYWVAKDPGSYHVAVWGRGTGTYSLSVVASDYVDDHSGVLQGATPVTVGEAVAGEIELPGDVDFFAFEAELGRLYQIDVTLGTLPNSRARLHGPDGDHLVSNAVHDDATGSRIYWVARASGSHYVAVSLWFGDTGTYTVSVVVSDVVDDHSGVPQQATPVTVGEATAGDIEHPGDLDFFVFEGHQGQLYQIDITRGTLPNSYATIYGPDGTQLETSYFKWDPTRLYWGARVSGHQYVAVAGWSNNTGTYTLSVVASDIVDDHSDILQGATPVTVGEAAAGEIHHETDVDFFVFEAHQGQLYQIDVTLGTMPDSIAELYDPDEVFLTGNTDVSAPRMDWQALNSGSLYVAVKGWSENTGTYALTIVTP